MTPSAAGKSGSRKGKGSAYDREGVPADMQKPAGVHESAGGNTKNGKIESLLSDIVTRLDRIEEKIDENVYPPQTAFRPEFITAIKKAQADIKKGKGKTYNSLDDFLKEIEA